jgi:UDP-N-acetylglucosamine diphosphorylase / glucose-1-phosphate thymidylyltransferase / UDP-N-acetylgalactosamine diphosphorylase / glucosamine-1-phosphate N-acetyltransferase / galactosamine-1-phosphate N-acetyltransferase
MPYNNRVKTLLIVAGQSTRFWPLKEKTLFPIAGKTLLEHQLTCLREGGCDDVTLVTGAHNKDEIAERFPDVPQIEQEDLKLGMRGAFLSSLAKIGKGPVLLVSGNDVIDSSAFADLRKAAAKKGVDGAILARKVSRYFPGGYLTVKKDRVTGIVEKPGEGKEPSDLVNIVAHLHNDPASLLAALKKAKTSRDDGYEVALQALFEEKHYVAVPYEGFWQAVKYPWHLLYLLPRFLSSIEKPRIHKTAKVHPTAVIDGDVILEEGVRVFAHATVKGPCVIGARSIVANNALVRASSVGKDCVIGYNTEVKGSVLGDRVWTHMTYLGDSVIGSNVSFGGGCITGNLRLDEKEILSAAPAAVGARHAVPLQPTMLPTGLTKFGLVVGNDVRFGIQVGSNPGVKVGSGTFVSGGAYLNADVSEQSFMVMKDGILTRKDNHTPVPGMDAREKFRKEGKF